MVKFLEGRYEELSLYVRQSAWLAATPERPKNDKSDAPRLSRLETLRKDRKDAEYQPDMPPLDGAGYLIGYLWEVGPMMAGGMGAGPITHEELRAWADLTGILLQPWEVRFMRRLSFEYLVQSQKSEKADCPAPWLPDAKPDFSSVQLALRNLATVGA